MQAFIIGGGIAGPATAMALQRVGIDATVLEARPRSAPATGSYFTIAPNGLAALDALGVLHLAREAGFPSRANVMVGATGRTLGRVSLGTALPDGTVALTMQRSRFADLLSREARERGIDVRRGSRVASVQSGSDGCTVVTDDGAEFVADLVIGADGVHSVVRRAIDPGAPAARYVGLTNFGGIARATPLAADLVPEAWNFVFGRQAFFGAHPTPSGDVVWFVNLAREEISRAERAATSHAQWQDLLVEALADDAGPGQELVATGELELAGDNTYDLGHVPTWSRERLAILGDALHAPAPSSGQGASMALEDAVVMATCLRDAASPPEAFAAFEAARRARVERVVDVGARASSAKIPGPVGRVVQEAALRLVFRLVATERSQRWLTGYRVDPLTDRGLRAAT